MIKHNPLDALVVLRSSNKKMQMDIRSVRECRGKYTLNLIQKGRGVYMLSYNLNTELSLLIVYTYIVERNPLVVSYLT